MSDLIDRQAAIDALTEYGNGRAVFISVGEAVIRIEQLPSAQPTFDARDTQYNLPIGTDCISRQAETDAFEKCMSCKHVYQRLDDADTLYCRCRKGCRYEEFKPRRSNRNLERYED